MREFTQVVLVSRRHNLVRNVKLPPYLIPVVSAILIAVALLTVILFFLNTRDMVAEYNINKSEHNHSVLLSELDSLRSVVHSIETSFKGHILMDNRQRTFWQIDPIHTDVWSMGIGGAKPPETYASLSNTTASMLEELYESVDIVTGQCLLREKSLADLSKKIESKQYLWAHIPSINPLPGRSIGSRFGYRVDPINKRTIRMHWGVDIGAPRGTAILATADGVVSFTGWNKGYGLCLDINHGFGFKTRYAHCSSILVKNGDIVKRGQIIARVGDTGRTTCPHLHYEVHVSGVKVDPMQYIDLSDNIID